jgi:hypothetical protein
MGSNIGTGYYTSKSVISKMEVAIDADTKYSNMMTIAAGCTTMV